MTAPTAGLILAAGLGTRFGGQKLQAVIDGKPMLQHVLDLAAAARLEPVVVILGADAVALEAVCRWRDEVRLVNRAPERGLSESVRLGLEALGDLDVQRVAVLLGDQPFLTVGQLRLILGERAPIIVPRYGTAPGNPVVLERSVWPLAASLEGDRGFSQLLHSHEALVRYVDVPGRNLDVDVPDDLGPISRA